MTQTIAAARKYATVAECLSFEAEAINAGDRASAAIAAHGAGVRIADMGKGDGERAKQARAVLVAGARTGKRRMTKREAQAAVLRWMREAAAQAPQTRFVRIGTDGCRLVIWSAGDTPDACDADLDNQAIDADEIGSTSMLEVPAGFDVTDITVEGREGLVVESVRANSNHCRVTCTATGDSCVVIVD